MDWPLTVSMLKNKLFTIKNRIKPEKTTIAQFKINLLKRASFFCLLICLFNSILSSIILFNKVLQRPDQMDKT